MEGLTHMTEPRELLAGVDIHRPGYHFLPAANWMNDPNGVIEWDGRYHLFYQYNPDGAYHANMHWGHAVSDDLIHWQELPIAIAPTPGSPDRGGIFSGCLVNDGGTPVAVYTGVNETYDAQTQCLAMGSADLSEWEKYAGNPVLADVPAEMGQTKDFRDPFVWRADDCWYMIVSSHIVGVGGAVLLYRSADLRAWEYRHPLFVGEQALNGYNFECANFLPLGDKWLLIISVQPAAHQPGKTLYWVGRFEGERFQPESAGLYDAGYSYASLCHQDERGRWLIYSWIREGRGVEAQMQAGWSGVQAIPRELSLDGCNRLVSQPVPELASLRGRHWHFAAGELDEAGLALELLALDIEADFAANSADQVGLALECGGESIAVLYERGTETLQVRRCYARDEPDLDSQRQGLVHRLDKGESLRLRILVDGSVIEVIANGRARVTSRFYPEIAGEARLKAISGAAIVRLDIWQMSAIG